MMTQSFLRENFFSKFWIASKTKIESEKYYFGKTL